jgi:hypothetical protein
MDYSSLGTRLRSKLTTEFFALSSLVTLMFLTRIIAFRENSLEPDEFEYLYAARKCLETPLPFSGFQTHTTGPFAIYILAFLKLITSFSKIYQLRLLSFFVFILPSFFIVYSLTKKQAGYIGVVVFSVIVSCKNFPFFGPFYDGIFSYNTEHPLLVVTAILSYIMLNKKTLTGVIIFSLLLFCLPLIKFQAIPLTLFFAFYFWILLLTNKQYHLLKISLLTFFSTLILWVAFLVFNGIYDEFYLVYVAENLNYISNNAFGQESVNPLNFLHRINTYYKFVILIILWGLFFSYQYVRKIGISFSSLVNHPIGFSGSFFIVSAITIILGKNDYGHYYVFLFLPTSLVASHIYMGLLELNYINKAFKPLFIILLLSFFNFDYLFKSINLATNIVLHKPTEHLRFGKPLQIVVDTKIVSWLKEHKEPNAALFSIGWDQSQVLYYLLQDDYKIMCRQTHFFFYKYGFEMNDKTMFDGEEKMLMEDLNKFPPLFIVDTWNIIKPSRKTLLQKYVDKNYTLVLNDPNYKIFKKIAKNR